MHKYYTLSEIVSHPVGPTEVAGEDVTPTEVDQSSVGHRPPEVADKVIEEST